jgi:hypothetical protein
MEQQDLKPTLGDVRYAYRLIAEYQRRVLDTMATLAEQFHGATFFGWDPIHHSSALRNDTNPFEVTPWRMLPLLFSSVLFELDTEERPTDSHLLEINHCGDSGVEGVEGHYLPDLEPSDLPDPGEGETTVSLYLWIQTGEAKLHWYNQFWAKSSLPYPADGETVEDQNLGVSGYGREFNLATLRERSEIEGAARSFQEGAAEALGIRL